jgi:hypothetical protein
MVVFLPLGEIKKAASTTAREAAFSDQRVAEGSMEFEVAKTGESLQVDEGMGVTGMKNFFKIA